MKKIIHFISSFSYCKFFFLTTFSLFLSNTVRAQKEVDVAKQYFLNNNTKEKLTEKDINEMVISKQYLSPTTGWYHIYFNQTFEKIQVYSGAMSVTIKDEKVAFVGNSFVKNILSKIPKVTTASITAKLALQKTLAEANISGFEVSETSEIDSEYFDNGVLSNAVYENKYLSNEKIKVKLYWFPVENRIDKNINTKLVLTWNVKIATKDGQHIWNTHVDANTGEIVQKQDDVIHCDFGKPDHESHANSIIDRKTEICESPTSPTANDGYNVFDYPLEAPSFGARTIVTNPYTRFFPATMGPGATNGWHNDGANTYNYTRGNNVWAKEDRASDNETTIGNYPISSTLDFNYQFVQDTGVSNINLKAAVTNLFYWNNLMHDVLWKYGFDEPSGNFQNDNMGKGGAENDFVYADAQDGSGSNNANFSTPQDGSKPRMQMFLFSNAGSPLYQPDSDFDNGIIAHEYGHGWSNRLSAFYGAEQAGEGWSDYLALMMTTNWALLNPTYGYASIPRGIATYALGQNPISGSGFRPYRYSYDKANYNDVVTYGKVADATNFLAPHGIGSIWCTMLWDMTWEIIVKDNFIAPTIYDLPSNIINMKGNIAALKLVNEGLRLQAPGASFVQARNAIFQADSLMFNGRYHCAIGKAFSRRGLGLNASTGESTNDRIVFEDFTAFGGAPLSSLLNNVVCSNTSFNYTATVADTGVHTFSWSRASVVGISNNSASGTTANISEILINTTSLPITVKYLFAISPYSCNGAPPPQTVNAVVNPLVNPTIPNYSICLNAPVPQGQGLLAITEGDSTNIYSGVIPVGQTFNRGTGTTTYIGALNNQQGDSVYYKTLSFIAPTTGIFTFQITTASLILSNSDTYLSLYQSVFNPSTPAVNFLMGDDDSGQGTLSSLSFNLISGTNYTIVVSTFRNFDYGTFILQVNRNIKISNNSWYGSPTGGFILANADLFNPVGLSGSGIPNTSNASITTFYVSNNEYPNCRATTTFTIAGNIAYVSQSNITGIYDGKTWATAYQNLQDALNATNVCPITQIWVAAGTYKPTTSTNRNISFAMKSNLVIYGGFPNTGTPSFAQRNATVNVTTLSGDIGIANDVSDNSYHVLNNGAGLNNTAVLDGFTITGGNANGTIDFMNVGGGMLNNATGASNICNPKIESCVFKNNNAKKGAAVYNNGVNAIVSPTFTNCVFQNNTAVNGAAIYNDGSTAGICDPIIFNTTFAENVATTSGSVVYSTSSGGTSTCYLTNCIFWNNGGAKTFFKALSSIQIKHSLFEPLVTSYTTVAGNISTSISPFVLPTDLHLKDSSNAIDAGINTGAPIKDIDFTIRTAMPDMGAFENISACVGSNKFYYTSLTGTSYQWQRNPGSGYVDIANGTLFNNINTQKLTVLNPISSNTGTKFRCKIKNGAITTYSPESTLRFYNRWLGTVDNNWLNAANWSCGTIPNQYTDVIIPTAKSIYPITNVSGTIRKLQSEIGSNITVATGGNLIILGQ